MESVNETSQRESGKRVIRSDKKAVKAQDTVHIIRESGEAYKSNKA